MSFSSTVYGDSFGQGTLAVTVGWSSSSNSSVTTEADVLVNNAIHFNSYRGSLQRNLFDFHRVVLHEFGHVLGLNHPDEAGQYVVAIMNSVTSNLDSLAQDDISGANFLYGYRITSSLEYIRIIRGDSFVYQITADNNPTSFAVTGFPPGVTLNRATGRMGGRPTQNGYYEATVTAHSPRGDASAGIIIDVEPPTSTSHNPPPSVVGDEIYYQVTFNRPFSSFSATNLPPGFRIDQQTGVISGTATLTGSYEIYVTATSATAGSVAAFPTFYVDPAPTQMVKKFSFAVNRLLDDSARKRVYATLPDTNSVAIIDSNDLSLIKRIPVAGEPKGMAMAVDGKKLFVARTSTENPTIEVVDLNTLTRIQGLSVPFPTFDLEVGLSGRLFATTWGSQVTDIFQMDSETGHLLAAFPRGLPYGFLEISPDRKTLYLGDTSGTPPSLVALDVSNDTPVIREQAPQNTITSVLMDLKLTHSGEVLFPAASNSGTLPKRLSKK